MPLESADEIKSLLENTNRIAMVGASPKAHRASNGVLRFLLEQGYDVIPVNPGHAGSSIHGAEVVGSLSDIEGKVDLVDIFRNSEDAGDAVDQAISIGAGAVWMQLGVINEDAAVRAEEAGLQVVMDRCPKIEIPRLGVRKA